MRYVVTGGTGFIGRHVVSRILHSDPDADVLVLVRRHSLARLQRQAWSNRVTPLIGDLLQPDLGLRGDPAHNDVDLNDIDHVLHCGALYDLTASADRQQAANVEGTRAVIALCLRSGAVLHHVSSIAVAGTYDGVFSEDDFDLGQHLPTPYHQTKFDAEKLVRETPGLRYRIYRPGVVVGDSRTGEMDKIDGPYYFFGLLAKLAVLPRLTPLALPDVGRINVVPVDYVADALVALMMADGHDGQTFHLTAPKSISPRGIYRALASTAGLPSAPLTLPTAPLLGAHGRVKVWRNMVATQLGIPAQMFDTLAMTSEFTAERTREALRGKGIDVPEFRSYAPVLWRYWAQHLAPRIDSRDPLAGRHVIITGASSGIGRAAAVAVAARGAVVFALARNGEALEELISEIRADGGQAHAFTCDVTDSESVQHTVTDILDRFGHVDYLVNNAGRSIRRSVGASTDRFHDYERVMAVNYFGAVRMVLALLPHWQQRRFGHVVNVSSAGVQASSPRYSAYLPTKAALDAFAEVVSTETLSDHVTFTTIHMPLVRTPMIAPSRRLNPIPAISPEHAAAMVVRGLVDKPVRIDTPLGTLGDAGRYLAPKVARRVLHQLYLGYPDSAAARGAVVPVVPAVAEEPRRPSRPTRSRVPRPAKRVARLVPGVHW